MSHFFITSLLGVGFMAVLVIGAVALVRGLTRSQTPGPQRLLAGLLGAAFLALFGIVGSGILVGTLAVMGGALLLEHGPVRSIEVLRLDRDRGMHTRGVHQVRAAARTLDEDAEQAYLAATAGLDPEYPLHVLVECQGEVRVDRLQRWLERKTHGDVVLVQARPVIREGEERTVLDFGLDVTQRELAHFEREFEEAQPFFDLPHGVRIRIEGR
ncbi:MAG: hypothetical protein V3T22_02775 [Planctomycetota bacterium]